MIRINKIIFGIIFLFTLTSCKANKKNSQENWSRIFTKHEATGTFVLYNLATEKFKYFNKTRADSGYIPASTFKILNSLIALETNSIADEHEIIKWDGSDKGWSKWNKDQNMETAISVSCVWFYQELAKRIGQDRMQHWIDSVQYGNRKMGGKVDSFWLQGDLRISANEQIPFLRKLIKNELPFATRNQKIVKKIMITDSTNNYMIHSKTGWGVNRTPQIGWLVGYVGKVNNTWIFAMNLDIRKKSDGKLRKEITYNILKAENIIE